LHLDYGETRIRRMRLSNVESGQRLPQRLFLRALSAASGMRPPDVIKTATYRPEIFGKAFGPVAHEVLRVSSTWSVGELELFGAFTSKLNQCRF